MLTEEQWEKFINGDLTVNCKTEDDAKEFIRECRDKSLKWYFNDETKWVEYGKHTVYDVCKIGNMPMITFYDMNLYKRYNIPIIEYEKEVKVMSEEDKIKFDELKKAAQPLIDFLIKYYHPMARAIVEEGCVEIVVGDMAVQLDVRD